jgi:hypothetical protein
MGQTLEFRPKDVYKGLLHLEDNDKLDSAVKIVSDGTGLDSPLALGTNSLTIGGDRYEFTGSDHVLTGTVSFRVHSGLSTEGIEVNNIRVALFQQNNSVILGATSSLSSPSAARGNIIVEAGSTDPDALVSTSVVEDNIMIGARSLYAGKSPNAAARNVVVGDNVITTTAATNTIGFNDNIIIGEQTSIDTTTTLAGTVIVGTQNSVVSDADGKRSVIVGHSSSANGSVVVGSASSSPAENGVVIGNAATGGSSGAVVIGQGANGTGFAGLTIATGAAVSVGSPGAITHGIPIRYNGADYVIPVVG